MVKRNTKRILVHIPSNLLNEFDKQIKGLYASRTEAIRSGMILLMENEKKQTTKNFHNNNIKQILLP